jgi:plastocyanin
VCWNYTHGLTTTAVKAQPPAPTRRGWGRWVARAVIALLVAALVGVVGLALLALADFDTAGNGSTDPRARARWTLERGDHLHYAVHIVAARLLDICPCTGRAAAFQYYRAHFHAVTPRQRAVAVDAPPRSVAGLVTYVAGPFGVVFDWIGDGISWLGGKHPALEVTVDRDNFAMQPREVHVARGTTVIWRNVDQLGEAHTVTDVNPVGFKSDFLEPDESFSFVFTERGRVTYYCSVHEGPGLQGMSGLIVVD